MKRIYINKLERDFDIQICKVNKEVLGFVSSDCIESITRSINDIDKISLTIDKYLENGLNGRMLNPLWNILKDERLLFLNEQEYFVIKTDNYSSDDKKSIVAYSLEYKLSKIDIQIEDISLQLFGSDIENDIYSLNDYLKEETGWSLGHVDDSVLYDTLEDGKKVEKLRIQSSVNKRWYDFLTVDISESFGAIVTFDSLNKLVNLYDIKTVGENITLYLSNDNYIKSLERSTSTEDIVTRLYVIGNDEMDIIDGTVTGYPYLENYDYFIENGEMSEELVSQLCKYGEMVEIRNEIWKSLRKEKAETQNILTRKKSELYVIYEEIRAKKSIKEVYSSKGDTVNEALISHEISKLIDSQTILEIEIKRLEEEIRNLNSSITEINILCKRETATDEGGELIFNEKTLEELKEFIYHDTYSNDSFINVEDLIDVSKRELDFKSKPTTEYSIDVENFMKRIINNDFRLNWQGDLGLGDIIILYDQDLQEEVFLYLTDYSQMPNDNENGLEITLSNKKYQDKNIRTIADKLKEGGLAMQMLNRKLYLMNEQKYKRINLKDYERDYTGGVH